MARWDLRIEGPGGRHQGSQMTNYQFVVERLAEMERAPGMYASTQESFGVQLALLVEFAELDIPVYNRFSKDALMNLIYGPGNVVHHEALEDDWARERLGNVRRLALRMA